MENISVCDCVEVKRICHVQCCSPGYSLLVQAGSFLDNLNISVSGADVDNQIILVF